MTRPDVIAYLRGLSLEEIQSVLTDIEDTWASKIVLYGTCSDCQEIVRGPHACPGPRFRQGAQTEFDVYLVRVPETMRIPVVQALRAFDGTSTLTELRDSLNRLPLQLGAGLSRAAAEHIRQVLSSAGATVEVR